MAMQQAARVCRGVTVPAFFSPAIWQMGGALPSMTLHLTPGLMLRRQGQVSGDGYIGIDPISVSDGAAIGIGRGIRSCKPLSTPAAPPSSLLTPIASDFSRTASVQAAGIDYG